MKQISIISAKGGVGKTTISTAFAALAKSLVLVDCDTESTDLRIFIGSVAENMQNVNTIQRVRIEEDECIRCGLCKALCHFNAVTNTYGVYQIREEHCQACDLCLKACPVSAIEQVKSTQNKWGEAKSKFGKVVYAQLALGEDLNGSLITILRERAKELAMEDNQELILIDGPPAVGYAVASAISNTDIAVVVLEPVPSAINELNKSKKLAERYEVPVVCLLNKSDLNKEMTSQIRSFCMNHNIPLVGEIPFDTRFVEAQNEGKSIIEFAPESDISQLMKTTFEAILL